MLFNEDYPFQQHLGSPFVQWDQQISGPCLSRSTRAGSHRVGLPFSLEQYKVASEKSEGYTPEGRTIVMVGVGHRLFRRLSYKGPFTLRDGQEPQLTVLRVVELRVREPSEKKAVHWPLAG